MDPAQYDLRRAHIAGEAVIDQLYDRLAARVRDAVIAAAEEKDGVLVLTPASRKRAAAALQIAYRGIFPAYRGGPSVLQAAIEAQCADVARKPVARVVAEIEAADPDLALAAGQEHV